MVQTRSGKDTQTSKPDTFPIERLPKELRNNIWEEALHLEEDNSKAPKPDLLVSLRIQDHRAHPKQHDKSIKWLAKGGIVNFFEFKSPKLASVCPESREAAKRLGRKQNKEWLQGRERTTPSVVSFLAGTGVPLLPLLPPDDYLVFNFANLPDTSDQSPFRNRELGQRFLELLLAAKDNQVKIQLPEHETFCLESSVTGPPLPKAAEGWVKQPPRAISVNDLNAWAELMSIASHYGYPWEFANQMLNDPSSRAAVVDKAVAPIRKLWQQENKRRAKSGLEALKELPKIDAVVLIDMQQGGTIGMLGFRGAPNKQHLKDMLDWGVL
ncbi:hypothetical protein QBC42DRAFT_273016 [Cladorrhinum samala]|uniref:2EXR domain-containing protein n=1 Tax=Cladorrhinum samala TaxID=585594 RepID=A0AAV9HJL6_9PEZI|nr:hypothetical protein QBC42DRAFT_273016 [Cladorrhinum samala]